ncbi:MAG: hypothetical protein ACTJHN_05625 [Glutamicibacter arilaitensis]
MDARAALEAISEFISAKEFLAEEASVLGPDSTDPSLDAIAEKFKKALSGS